MVANRLVLLLVVLALEEYEVKSSEIEAILVSLQENTRPNTWAHLCSALLLGAESIAVTAAHCFENRMDSLTRIKVILFTTH